MKRLSMFGALAVAMLAAFTFSPAAKADQPAPPQAKGQTALPAVTPAVVTCSPIQVNGTGWPYTSNVKACTGTSANNQILFQDGLSGAVAKYTVAGKNSAGPKLQALNPIVYLFHDPASYNTFIQGTNCSAAGQGAFAITFPNPTCSITGNKPYTVVFELTNNDTLPDTHIANTAAHEMGHWYDDFILGSITNFPNNLFSHQNLFKHEQNVANTGNQGDYPVFNALGAPCSGGNHPFAGQQDWFVPPNYICANSGQGPGLNASAPPAAQGGPYTNYNTNTGVLGEATGPYYVDPAELFAEEVAANVTGIQSWNVIDHYMLDWFQCTQILMLSELQYGAAPDVPPSPYIFPASCPLN